MRNTILAMLGALTLSASAGAQMHRAQAVSLTAQQVTDIIRTRLAAEGVDVPDAHIQLLSRVAFSSERPALRVTSIEPLDHSRPSRRDLAEGVVPRYAVRMACSSTRECLPFYAVVSSPENLELSPAAPAVEQSAKVTRPDTPKAPAMVRAGSKATVVMTGDAARIEMTVTCLEDGSEGQVIHVSNPLNKQTFQAQVVSPGLLKGAF